MDKKQVIGYLKKNEIIVSEIKGTVLSYDLMLNSLTEKNRLCRSKFSPIFSLFYHTAESDKSSVVFMEKTIRKTADKLYDDFNKNPDSLMKKIKKADKLAKKITKIWEKYSENRGDISSLKRKDIFLEAVEIAKIWHTYTAISYSKEYILNQIIIPAFAKLNKLELEKAKEIVGILSQDSEVSVFEKERKHLLELGLYLVNASLDDKNFTVMLEDKSVERKVNSYLKEYYWIKTDSQKVAIITPEIILGESAKLARELGAEKVEEEIKKIENKERMIEKQKDNILFEFAINKESKSDIDFARKIIVANDIMQAGYMKIYYCLLNIFEDLAKEKNVSKTISKYLLSELVELVKNEIKPSEAELELRDNAMFVVWERNKRQKLFYGDEAKEILSLDYLRTDFNPVEIVK